MTKRREKRRHSPATSSSIDLKDPLFLLQLAVRIDESINPEFLNESLRFYGNVEEFKRAVSYLTKGNRKQPTPTSALTPVILSGLIAAQQAREEQEFETKSGTNTADDADTTPDATSKDPSWPSASELLSCCQYMRQQALDRIARKRRTRKVRIVVFVVAIGFVAGLAFQQTISSLQNNMLELGFVPMNQTQNENELTNDLRPCSWFNSTNEERACRAAEASVWAYFRDYSSSHSATLRDCTRRKCLRDSRNIMRRQLSSIHGRSQDVESGQGPYSMHTIATRETLTLKTPFAIKTSSTNTFDPWWAPNEDDGRIKKGLQWLGDTMVNRLVRKRLLGVIKNQKDGSKFLDVGCGIGGTLYALAGAAEDRWSSEAEFPQMDYVGIAISSAEVLNARRLVSEHELDLDERVQFQQTSFDSPSLKDHGKFSAAVAIESLSFSQNVSTTLSNLANVIQPGGTIIVVDDAVENDYRECSNNTDVANTVELYSTLSARPSLLTHNEWIDAFDKAGFDVQEAIDIGLHYSLPQLVADGNSNTRRGALRERLLQMVRRSKHQPNVFLKLLQKWEAWTKSRNVVFETGEKQVDVEYLARLQAIQLLQNNIKFIRSKSYRKKGHEHLDLTYNMYVCTKR